MMLLTAMLMTYAMGNAQDSGKLESSGKPSATQNEKFAMGLGYPYLSAKYKFIPELAVEARVATGEGISVYGGRMYWNFYFPTESIGLFTGVEYGRIQFNTLGLNGTGHEVALLVGGEFFISQQFSLHLDIAPSFISLNSNKVSAQGIEWVTNAAIYGYIF